MGRQRTEARAGPSRARQRQERNGRMEKQEKRKRLLQWQPIGQRIIKTSIAVTLCLFFYMWRGYQGESMPAEAAITAIICMQPYIHDTRKSALTRLAGTMIGALWGFLFLLLMLLFPSLGGNQWVLYPLMGVGTMLSLYNAVLIRQQDAAGLAAIVFVCVVIAFPDITDPMEQAFRRILDVLVGTVTALAVNAVHLPRTRMHSKVFFVRMRDLAEDQFSRLTPAVLFRLQNLYQEGANICLMSQHAPAFHASQLDHVKFTVPLIVMDGAAIYDANENVYLTITHPEAASCRWLIRRLESMDVSFFVYTVHRDRNCIYHHGPLSEPERQVYLHLKKSPYRYYLDEDHYAVSDVVYLKIVTAREEAERIQRELQPLLEKTKLRSVVRPQAGIENGYSLYFYAAHADVAHAQAHLMQLLRQNDATLEMHDMISRNPYRSEHDAVQLLKKLSREYEPNFIKARRMKRRKEKLARQRVRSTPPG